jgi:hypothetical protein
MQCKDGNLFFGLLSFSFYYAFIFPAVYSGLYTPLLCCQCHRWGGVGVGGAVFFFFQWWLNRVKPPPGAPGGGGGGGGGGRFLFLAVVHSACIRAPGRHCPF